MNLLTLASFLACLSSAFAQFLSTNDTTKNACGAALAVPANATGGQDKAVGLGNGLGRWRVAVSTNSSAASIQDGRTLTENSPGAVANVWLDPFVDVSLQDGSNGFSACAYIFKGLPENTIRRGQDDDTSCTQMFSKSCVDAITSRAAQTAQWLVQNPTLGPYSNLTPPIIAPICQTIFEGIGSVDSFPSECTPYFEQDQSDSIETDSYPYADVLVLTSNKTVPRNCSFNEGTVLGGNMLIEDYNAPPGVQYPWNATNGSAVASYDELVQQVWPILTVTFPPANNSREASVGNSIGTMTCVKADNVKTDSRVPPALPAATAVHFPGQLSGGEIAGIVIGSVLGGALILAAAWWFWWRRRSGRSKGQKLADSKETDGTHVSPEAGGKEVYQMDAKNTPSQIDGTQRVELEGQDARPELAGEHVAPQELPGSTPAATS